MKEKMTREEVDALVNSKPKSEVEKIARRPGESMWDLLDRLAQEQANRDTDRRRAKRLKEARGA